LGGGNPSLPENSLFLLSPGEEKNWNLYGRDVGTRGKKRRKKKILESSLKGELGLLFHSKTYTLKRGRGEGGSLFGPGKVLKNAITKGKMIHSKRLVTSSLDKLREGNLFSPAKKRKGRLLQGGRPRHLLWGKLTSPQWLGGGEKKGGCPSLRIGMAYRKNGRNCPHVPKTFVSLPESHPQPHPAGGGKCKINSVGEERSPWRGFLPRSIFPKKIGGGERDVSLRDGLGGGSKERELDFYIYINNGLLLKE